MSPLHGWPGGMPPAHGGYSEPTVTTAAEARWAYYELRATTIDGRDLEPRQKVRLTLECIVVPMGDGSHGSPRQLQILDWAGPEVIG